MLRNPFNREPKQRIGRSSGKTHQIRHEVEIASSVDRVFEAWTRLEELPEILDAVRRVKCTSATRSLWDVDIAGRQVVWEAETTAFEPRIRIAWKSCWGVRNRGEIRFHQTIERSTRLEVSLEFEPTTLLERLAARLDLVGQHVESDLSLFRRHVEALQANEVYVVAVSERSTAA